MAIKTGVFNGVATIEIARPEKKNAITAAMYGAMAQALHDAGEDRAVRAVLLTGQPGVFTSGNDLDDFLKNTPSDDDAPVFLFMRALLRCEKPVVAAVTGAAIGIGATMLLHCDLVYVSDEARLALPFVNLGLVPEFASSWLLPQLAGRVKAAEKLLLGDPFSAADAVEMGLANAVLPAGEVLRHARQVAERFNRLPPAAVRETKKLLGRSSHDDALKAIDLEAAVFRVRLASPEFREAVSAFFERRTPDFSNFD